MIHRYFEFGKPEHEYWQNQLGWSGFFLGAGGLLAWLVFWERKQRGLSYISIMVHLSKADD